MIAKDYYTKNNLMSNICSKILKEVSENNMIAMQCKKNQEDDDQLNLEDVKYEIRKIFNKSNNNNINSFDKQSNKLIKECQKLQSRLKMDNLVEECQEFASYLNKSICEEIKECENYSLCIYLFQHNSKIL